MFKKIKKTVAILSLSVLFVNVFEINLTYAWGTEKPPIKNKQNTSVSSDAAEQATNIVVANVNGTAGTVGDSIVCAGGNVFTIDTISDFNKQTQDKVTYENISESEKWKKEYKELIETAEKIGSQTGGYYKNIITTEQKRIIDTYTMKKLLDSEWERCGQDVLGAVLQGYDEYTYDVQYLDGYKKEIAWHWVDGWDVWTETGPEYVLSDQLDKIADYEKIVTKEYHPGYWEPGEEKEIPIFRYATLAEFDPFYAKLVAYFESKKFETATYVELPSERQVWVPGEYSERVIKDYFTMASTSSVDSIIVTEIVDYVYRETDVGHTQIKKWLNDSFVWYVYKYNEELGIYEVVDVLKSTRKDGGCMVTFTEPGLYRVEEWGTAVTKYGTLYKYDEYHITYIDDIHAILDCYSESNEYFEVQGEKDVLTQVIQYDNINITEAQWLVMGEDGVITKPQYYRVE